MFLIGIVVFLFALIVSWVGFIWLTIVAFRQSAGWGRACLFIPFASFVFVTQFWEESAKPFLVSMCPIPFAMIGFFLMVLGAPGIQIADFFDRIGFRTSSGENEHNASPAFQPSVTNPSRRNPFDPSPAVTGLQPERSSPSAPETLAETISRGDLFQPESPLAPLPSIRFDVNEVLPSSVMGLKTGSEFLDAAPNGGILVGLRIGLNGATEGSVATIQPIYQVGGQCFYGGRHGRNTSGPVHELTAKSGYAVAGLLLQTSTVIESIQVIFSKVKSDGRLDPSDKYLSERIGRDSGAKRRIFGSGSPIVEVFGFASSEVRGVGLGIVQTSPVPPLKQAERADQAINAEKVDRASTGRQIEGENRVGAGAVTEVENKRAAEPIRTWTSGGGKFKVDAKFKSMEGSTVVLEQVDGQTVRVAIDKLSSFDQEYLKSRQD